MIGANPTVGCMLFFDKDLSSRGVNHVLNALDLLIPKNDWQLSQSGARHALTITSGEQLQVMVTAQETDNGFYVLLDFDEEILSNISCKLNVDIFSILSPYIELAKTVIGASTVGVGFELSPPIDMSEDALRDSGIALLFKKNTGTDYWASKQLLPMVGH